MKEEEGEEEGKAVEEELWRDLFRDRNSRLASFSCSSRPCRDYF
jgi:hypothetical protein